MPQENPGEDKAIGLRLTDAVPLSQFLVGHTPLTVAARRLIVEQAIGVLEHVYVHLPIKQALYGIDPVARLRALRDRLDVNWLDDDLPFHSDMVAILSTCLDMHTGYYLPRPFDRAVAFLPFQIEEYHDGPARRYIVPRILLDYEEVKAAAPDFQRGVEILEWDGDPIDDAVIREGEASPGINADARHARGVYRITTRFLAKCPPPERETVRVTYRTEDGKQHDIEVRWRVVSLPPEIGFLPEGVPIGQARDGLDFETEVYRAFKSELTARGLDRLLPAEVTPIESTMPTIFEAFVRPSSGTPYGYLRIRSFSIENPAQALAEFADLISKLPKTGLIIDIRDNPGGSIQAAEMMLQALASHPLDRAPLVLRTTPFILRLCQRRPDLYSRWIPTLERAQRTGVMFSGGIPLWPDEDYAGIGCCYPGKIVLIVNALTYSAADFFASGFQDHALGTIVGVHGSTGGGGGNVWTLRGMVDQIGHDRDRFAGLWVPVPLPAGADVHMAFRRSLRTGLNAGLEVEDFGVTPNTKVHLMTQRDILEGNADLFETAVGYLRRDEEPVTGAA